MPRYYYHVHDGRSFLDDVGSEFESDDDARVEALRSCRDLLRGSTKKEFWTGGDWRMEVTNQNGRCVATLNFHGSMHESHSELSH